MRRAELVLAALAALAVLALLVAPLGTPYWWDAGAVYAPGAKWVLDHAFDARPGVFPDDLSRGHIPLYYLILAGVFRLFGPGPASGHAVALGFATMAVAYTYALGRQLSGRAAGVVAAALLVAAPLFQTMASEALPEMPLTALTAASFYAFARGRLVACAVWCTVLVLAKETGVACPLAIAGALALSAARSRDLSRERLRTIAMMLAPAILLAAFFVWQKLTMGWFVTPYHQGLYEEPHSWAAQTLRVAATIVVADGRGIALAAAVVLVALRGKGALGPGEPRATVLVALGLQALMNLAFFTKMWFLDRYTLPVHVGAVVVIACALVPAGATLRARAPGLAAAGLAIAVGLSRRDAGTGMASGETSFRYLHAVHAYSALYRRMEAAGGAPVVLTDWPVTDELREPWMGWVSRPFRCVHVNEEYQPGQGPAVDRVVAVGGLGSYERLIREARALGFHRIDAAEEGGASIELWGP